jgi:glycosyltransferase involved in cell wall biosynthesis
VVNNGYDDSELPKPSGKPTGGKISIVFAGTISEVNSPILLLDAFDRLPSDIAGRFELRLIGRVAEEFDQSMLLARKCPPVIVGFVAHQEALAEMAQADLLFCPGYDELTLNAKLYEYLGCGRPILALAKPGGDMDRIVRQTRSGWCVDPTNQKALDSLLTELATNPTALHLSPDADERAKFTRRNLARRYARIIRGEEDSPIGM